MLTYRRAFVGGVSLAMLLGGIVEADPMALSHAYPLRVNFAFDKADLRLENGGQASFQKVAEEMHNFPYAKMEIDGFTDKTGPVDYNQKLSEQRAIAVQQYFEKHYQISPNRMVVRAFGKERPVMTNTTPEGRQENRRAVARVYRLEPPAAGTDRPTL